MKNLSIALGLLTLTLVPAACGESSNSGPAAAGSGSQGAAGLDGSGGESGSAWDGCSDDSDCASGQRCASGTCVPNAGDGGDGGEGGEGGEGAAAAGAGGQGGAAPASTCNVLVLVQNSGAMFELPTVYDSYFYWLREAFSTSGAVESLLERAQLGISFFMSAEELPECPDVRHHAIGMQSQIATAFDTTVTETGGVNKSDAPLADAVSGAAGVLADTAEAHLILVITGSPDTCQHRDGLCGVDPAIAAIQAAAAAGITTHVLGLGDETMLDAFTNGGDDGFEMYLTQLANAGLQQPVAKQAMFDIIYGAQCPALEGEYQDELGNAQAVQALEKPQLVLALDELLDNLCQ